MDLKKRLASLDRLSRKQGGFPDPSIDGGDPEVTLRDLGLRETDGHLWVRDYEDDLPPPALDLPDLEGFFSRTAPSGLAHEDLLFLDTETTGLAGGTGTIPFLVGVSWWSGEVFQTRQYFLSGPGREGPLLTALENLAKRFKAVVTFNGASFDLPLLRTRARMERRVDPLAGLVSWDLLVPARRLWSNALPDCRQQTLEVALCGQKRLSGDIDGAHIPQAWFEFLASGQPGVLPQVLTHNHRDMKGMALVFNKVVETARWVDDTGTGSAPTWKEAWSLGRICENRCHHDLARHWLEVALVAGRQEGNRVLITPRFLKDTVRILKRGGDWLQVEDVITAGMAAGVKDPWLHREAAILYEHRLVRLDQALHHAQRANEDKRVRRLEQRLATNGKAGT